MADQRDLIFNFLLLDESVKVHGLVVNAHRLVFSGESVVSKVNQVASAPKPLNTVVLGITFESRS